MRFAIIGAQHFHIVGISREAVLEPDIELVAVVERQDDVREQLSKEFGVPGYTDYRDLLASGKVDAVAIAPINSEKGALIVECLDAGVHALVDKPGLTTLEDLDKVEAALARGRARLYCALTLRFSPHYAMARSIVARGDIGTVVGSYAQRPHKLGIVKRPDWMFKRTTYGGALLDLGIHDIDMMRWLHNAEPTTVMATEGNVRFTTTPEFTDHYTAAFRFPNNVAGLVRGSWLTPDATPWHGDTRLFVEGAKGYLEIRDKPTPTILLNTNGNPREITEFHATDEVEPRAHQNAMLRDFVAVTQGRSDTVLTPHDVIESHRWTLLARQAAETGGLVRRG